MGVGERELDIARGDRGSNYNWWMGVQCKFTGR